jgi:hypothetical protein
LIKAVASFIASVLLSLLAAYSDFVPINERSADTYYYSFEHLFLFTLTKLLFFYFIIVLPLTFYLDILLSSKITKFGTYPKQLIRTIVHAISGIIVAIPISYVLGVLPEARQNFVIACSAGIIIFLFFEFLLKGSMKMFLRRKNE